MLRALAGVIVLLVLVVFLLSNREGAVLAFWPFGELASLPLGAVVIAAGVLGFLGGAVMHLPRRFRAQRRAKRAEQRLAEMQTSLPAVGAPALPGKDGSTTIRG